MASHRITIRLDWENQVQFKVDFRKDSGEWLSVLQSDENGELKTLWPHISRVAQEFFKAKMAEIGAEMAY